MSGLLCGHPSHEPEWGRVPLDDVRGPPPELPPCLDVTTESGPNAAVRGSHAANPGPLLPPRHGPPLRQAQRNPHLHDPGVADLQDTEDEEQDPPEGTSTSTCTNDNDSNLLPAPATFERQPRYNIEDHLNTSANMNDSANSSGMDARSDRASGCSTPRFRSDGWDLVDRAGRLFESLWDPDTNAVSGVAKAGDLRHKSASLNNSQLGRSLRSSWRQDGGCGSIISTRTLITPAPYSTPKAAPTQTKNGRTRSASWQAPALARSPNALLNATENPNAGTTAGRERSRRRDDRDRDRERHLHPRRPHGLSTAPWRARPRSPAHPPPRNHASRESSSVRSTHNGPSQAEQALSMNRHTWRNLLCLSDEGPGTDVTRHLSVPLPSEAMENVLETVHNMPTEHRVAFLASLLRFLLEVAQQISEVVVTNDVNADPNPHYRGRRHSAGTALQYSGLQSKTTVPSPTTEP